ncbi:hypothetical protein DFP72DRAFT_362321 [Ephemerocybe angulata]|uniref:DUF6533 domain-containing protein n=1 Tax=Ephemerocybe angulata TaxID=980116 RepID=A0A8H6M773_9AGAR|nr:hypothetical protein DFP72DRAFT_362321 [Tulosesus angulatus]
MSTVVTGPASAVPTVGEEVLVTIAALAIGGFVSFSLIMWDYICHLPDEARLLKDYRRTEWRVPDTWAFFMSRYCSFLFAILSLFNLTLKTDQCQLVASFSQILSLAVVGASGILTARRTIAIWAEQYHVVTLLGTTYVVMLATWVASASGSRSDPLPARLPGFGTNCVSPPLPPWSPINYASSMVFFSFIFVLTLYKLIVQRTDHVLNLGLTPLNRACIWYFMVNAATSTSLFIVTVNWHKQWTSETAKKITAPFFIVLIAAMNQRIYLNNRADNTLRKIRVQEIPEGKQGSGRGVPRWSFVTISKPIPILDINLIPSNPRAPPPPPDIPADPPVRPMRKKFARSLSLSSVSAFSSKFTKSRKSIKRDSDLEGFSSPPTSPGSTRSSEYPRTQSPFLTVDFGSPLNTPPGLPWPGMHKKAAMKQKQRQTESSWASMFRSQPASPAQESYQLPSTRSPWAS